MILYSSVFFCAFYCIFTHDQTAAVFTHPVDHCQTFKLLLLSKFDKKSLDDSVFFCIFSVFFTVFYTLAVFFYSASRPLSNVQGAIVI